MVNWNSVNKLSVLVSEIIRTSKLALARLSLFLTEFILIWTITIVNELSIRTCLIPLILSLEGGLQIGVSDSWDVLKFVSCIISKTKAVSFRCSPEHQSFQIWLRKLRANLPFPFAFKYKPFLLRRLSLILSFSTHSMLKLERCLLWFRLVSAGMSLLLRNVCLDTTTLQLCRDFKIADLNRIMSSTIFLES